MPDINSDEELGETTHPHPAADLVSRGVEPDFAAKLVSYLDHTRGNWCKCWAAVNGALPDMPPWEVSRWLRANGYPPLSPRL